LVHPENPGIKEANILEITESFNRKKIETPNTVVVSPDRFDRYPYDTDSCARIAILYTRSQLVVV